MRKLICIAMTLALLACGFALGEEETDAEKILEELNGQVFTFSSGVGGWSTVLTFGENGAFTGEFHDSEMGDAEEAFPNGTVYLCSFHGRVSSPVHENVGMWSMALEMEKDDTAETIEDGIRFLKADPYGLEKAERVILYLPGTPVDFLPEGFMFWSHLNEIDPHASSLPYYAIWSEEDESGFIGEIPQTGMANPWKEVTPEELLDVTGAEFGLPEGAENVTYYMMNGGELAEMRFTIGDIRFTARIREAEAFTDISGMYESWEAAEGFNFDWCPGAYWIAEDGEEEVHLCLWYDPAPGWMYSLSAEGTGLEGFDLKPAARTVYIPTQTDGDE